MVTGNYLDTKLSKNVLAIAFAGDFFEGQILTTLKSNMLNIKQIDTVKDYIMGKEQ